MRFAWQYYFINYTQWLVGLLDKFIPYLSENSDSVVHPSKQMFAYNQLLIVYMLLQTTNLFPQRNR